MGDNSNVNMKQDHEQEYLIGLPYMYARTYIHTYIHQELVNVKATKTTGTLSLYVM